MVNEQYYLAVHKCSSFYQTQTLSALFLEARLELGHTVIHSWPETKAAFHSFSAPWLVSAIILKGHLDIISPRKKNFRLRSKPLWIRLDGRFLWRLQAWDRWNAVKVSVSWDGFRVSPNSSLLRWRRLPKSSTDGARQTHELSTEAWKALHCETTCPPASPKQRTRECSIHHPFAYINVRTRKRSQ